ncbi:hypothetical protein JMUB6875_03740 [Nocardia sp. JMUB6875]
MPSFRAVRSDLAFATTIFTGPVALWLWSELAVLHGRGPTPSDFLNHSNGQLP